MADCIRKPILPVLLSQVSNDGTDVFHLSIKVLGLWYSSCKAHGFDSLLRKHAHAIYRVVEIKIFVGKIDIYAPNFEEVEGAYWFGSVRAVSE